MILVSSNQTKIKEFKSYFPDLTIQSGSDIKEVLGNVDEVILYKSLEAGKNYVVEDTIVSVDGKEIVEIRWKKHELKNGQQITWTTSLGYFKDDKIYVFRGVISGTVCTDRLNEKGFGFDDLFIPDGLDKTLYELELEGKKGEYSARKFALQNLKDGNYIFSRDVNTIPEWNGLYQNN